MPLYIWLGSALVSCPLSLLLSISDIFVFPRKLVRDFLGKDHVTSKLDLTFSSTFQSFEESESSISRATIVPVFPRNVEMKKAGDASMSSSKIVFKDCEGEEHNSSYSSSSSSEEEEEIERELAEVTFEELQKARSDGSHMVYQKPNQEKKTRANKNRPMEVSCKKPVSRFREVVQAPKKVVRDPRYESLCGQLDTEGFRKRYDFLFEDNLPAEREELKKQLKKARDPEVIEDLKKRITWIEKQLKFESTKSKDSAILSEHKKKEREATKHGKKPYYLKKSEIRKQRLIEKYNGLKASGKLESFLEKRRRKNAAKDHRYMPYRRPNNSEH